MWKRSCTPAVVNQPSLGTVTSISMGDRRMRVRFQATEWFALANEPLTAQPGDRVQVMGRVNATTLLVADDAA